MYVYIYIHRFTERGPVMRVCLLGSVYKRRGAHSPQMFKFYQSEYPYIYLRYILHIHIHTCTHAQIIAHTYVFTCTYIYIRISLYIYNIPDLHIHYVHMRYPYIHTRASTRHARISCRCVTTGMFPSSFASQSVHCSFLYTCKGRCACVCARAGTVSSGSGFRPLHVQGSGFAA